MVVNLYLTKYKHPGDDLGVYNTTLSFPLRDIDAQEEIQVVLDDMQ